MEDDIQKQKDYFVRKLEARERLIVRLRLENRRLKKLVKQLGRLK